MERNFDPGYIKARVSSIPDLDDLCDDIWNSLCLYFHQQYLKVAAFLPTSDIIQLPNFN